MIASAMKSLRMSIAKVSVCITKWSPYLSMINPGNPSLSLQTTRQSLVSTPRRARYSAACATRRLKKSKSSSCFRREKRRATICDLEL
jgi:hypothetical protein